MASIVYVTNNNMIQYHRMNGNQMMNFWRPSYSKKINDFNESDYLFFLVKTGLRKEKGIVGYGKCRKNHTLTFNQMWESYKTLNGYETKEELKEAVLKAAKKKAMPEKLNCIYLDDVVFFQSPIYLSEVGVSISNHLESYFYLDKEENVTNKILDIARDSGVDLWSSMQNPIDEQVNIKEDQVSFVVRQAFKQYSDNYYTEYEKKKIRKLLSNIKDENILVEKGALEVYSLLGNNLVIYIPILSSKFNDNGSQYAVGHAMLIKDYIHKNLWIKLNITFKVLSDTDAKEIESLLNS